MDPISVLMAPLFKQARTEGKWFFSSYQQLWFSPDELEATQRAGRFRWGPDNWRLRDPTEYLAESKRTLDAAREEHERRFLKIAGIKLPQS